jgi:hypothetical protein
MVRCSDATASSFVAIFRGEVFAHFNEIAVKRHNSKQNWLFGLPERIFLWTITSMSKKIMSMLLTLLFTCLAFSVSASLDFLCTAQVFFPERLSNARVSVALFRDLHNMWCCSFVGSVAKESDTRLQINGRKKSASPLSCKKFLNRLPR